MRQSTNRYSNPKLAGRTSSKLTSSGMPKSMTNRLIKGVTAGTYKAIQAKYPNATPYMRMVERNILGGKKLDSFVADALSKGMGQSGVTLPGMGVIAAARTAYGGTTTNKGSGITKTTYEFGEKRKVPDSIKDNNPRFVWLASGADYNFSIANPTAVTQGTGVQTFYTSGTMSVLRAYLDQDTSAIPDGGSDKIYLKDCNSKVTITSASNLNQTLRIYECIAKRDILNTVYNNPEVAWSTGIDNLKSNQNPDGASFRLLGLFPGNSPAFRTYWHVDKYYDIELKAGATHIHESLYNINDAIQNDVWLQNNSGTALAGLTRAYLFVLNTSPIHDSATETNVAMGIGKVDINIQQQYEYHAMRGTRSYLNWTIAQDAITNAEVVTDGFVESPVVNGSTP